MSQTQLGYDLETRKPAWRSSVVSAPQAVQASIVGARSYGVTTASKASVYGQDPLLCFSVIAQARFADSTWHISRTGAFGKAL